MLSRACDLRKPHRTQELRDHFARAARTWIRLADDLERTLVIFDAEDDETEPERLTG